MSLGPHTNKRRRRRHLLKVLVPAVPAQVYKVPIVVGKRSKYRLNSY